MNIYDFLGYLFQFVQVLLLKYNIFAIKKVDIIGWILMKLTMG